MEQDKAKERFLKHFETSKGVISIACKKSRISRQTYYNWIKQDNDFKEKVHDISEEQIDYVESKLIENIEKNDTTAIIFYLKTKAKERGYTDKTQVEVSTSPQDLFLNLMKEAAATD